MNSSHPKYITGQKVDLLILRETPMGFAAQINQQDEGLLYHNEIFEEIEPGQKIEGYISRVRDDGRIDLNLQAPGNFGSEDVGERILEELKHSGGRLNLTSKTSAEDIYELFGVSKKKYKIALGALYKKRLIKILDTHIELNN